MSGEASWEIPGNLTIYEVQSNEQVCPLLKQPELRWQLDLQKTQEVDSAGVQWLLSLALRLESAGGGLCLVSPNDNVISALHLMGVTELLSIKESDQSTG